LEILEDEQDGSLNTVLHCFSSGIDTLERAISLGSYVSFTGNITFKKSILSEVVQKAPLDRIMLETDSPYMAPVPFRGKRNEPARTIQVAEKIAEIKSLSIEEVIKMTTKNAKKFFNLLLLLLMISTATAFSQRYDDSGYNDENSKEFEEADENPYKKFIGFGPGLGLNTIVVTQMLPQGENSISYDGLLAYGGCFTYSPLSFLVLEASYTYSKNNKLVETYPEFNFNPSTYQVYEFTSHWIANPNRRINFFATIGLTYFNSLLGGSYGKETKVSELGINTGVGFYINIPTNWGLLTPSFEWRLDFFLNRIKDYGNVAEPSEVPKYRLVDAKTFFSIPRVGLIFYPSF
jgi:hypothetical protein